MKFKVIARTRSKHIVYEITARDAQEALRLALICKFDDAYERLSSARTILWDVQEGFSVEAEETPQ